jgi:hypothetical protein
MCASDALPSGSAHEAGPRRWGMHGSAGLPPVPCMLCSTPSPSTKVQAHDSTPVCTLSEAVGVAADSVWLEVHPHRSSGDVCYQILVEERRKLLPGSWIARLSLERRCRG